jgi:CRP-like cAMP-binding protein
MIDLTGVELFSELSEDDLRELAGWFDVRTVGAGERIVDEGASGYSFYVLLEGAAEVATEGVSIATCHPGDFFGEIAILGASRRTATVTTTVPSRVLVMFGTEFRRLQQLHPAVAGRLEDAMRSRLPT